MTQGAMIFTYDDADMKDAEPLRPLLVFLWWRESLKSLPSLSYKLKLHCACMFVIKPSQFRKFKPLYETTFPASNSNPYTELFFFYFQALGAWNYIPVLHKTIHFPAVISRSRVLNCVLSMR
jgi:hypothetical protein